MSRLCNVRLEASSAIPKVRGEKSSTIQPNGSCETDLSVRSLSEDSCGRSAESKVWNMLCSRLTPIVMLRRVIVWPAGMALKRIMLDKSHMFE